MDQVTAISSHIDHWFQNVETELCNIRDSSTLKTPIKVNLSNVYKEISSQSTLDTGEQNRLFQKYFTSLCIETRPNQTPLRLLKLNVRIDSGNIKPDITIYLKLPDLYKQRTKSPSALFAIKLSCLFLYQDRSSPKFQEELKSLSEEMTILKKAHDILRRNQLPSLKPYVDGVEISGSALLYRIITRYHTRGDLNSQKDVIRLRRSFVPFFSTLSNVLATLHESRIIHRDVKPSNIFIDQNGQPILGDFGSSIMSNEADSKKNYSLTAPFYAAKETFEKTYDNPKSDVWSLGMTMLDAFFGSDIILRYLDRPCPIWTEKMRTTSIESLKPLWDSFLANLTKRFSTPSDRSFVTKLQEYLQKTMILDVNERPTMREAHTIFFQIFSDSLQKPSA